MSSKPKKTLSEEQLKKMQEGRKRAAQKRAKEREEAARRAEYAKLALNTLYVICGLAVFLPLLFIVLTILKP